jgi:chemotaxis protein MotB
VVEEIVKGGVNPATLSAGGYGPYLPVAANDSDDGRKKNRRVEFLLLPDLGDLFDLAK